MGVENHEEDSRKGVEFQSNEMLVSNEESGSFLLLDSLKEHKTTYSRSLIDGGLTLAWNNLSVYARSKIQGKIRLKRIINGVSGAIKPGSLVALMGSSGAGKSTLMSSLAYRTSADVQVEGDILINGREIGSYLKHLSGYMHQEDILLPYLTAWEHMNIMAHLKLDRRIVPSERTNIIYNILGPLGLLKCMHSRIGGIDRNKALSGGEKKRLAFATELLTEPAILFCDEPTTGLDSYSAQKLVTMMSKMAAEGRTIICTIHQPSPDIFALFSQLILVAEGRIAYMGSTQFALDFFKRMGYECPSTFSPPDFFIKTISMTPGYEDNCRQTIKRICDNYVVSDYAKDVEITMQYEFHKRRTADKIFESNKDFKAMHWYVKLFWLTYRWFLEIRREPSIALWTIIQRLVVAIIIGLCYFETNALTQSGIQAVQGMMFLFVSENTFTPMYTVLAQFPVKQTLFLREYRSGIYSPILYYVSRIFALIPGFIVEPVLFSIVAYGLSGLRATSYAFLMTTLIIVLTMNVSAACGIMFSNAFESIPSSMAYLVPFDYVLMITSGLFLKLSTIPIVLTWTKYLSWIMYSTEALSILQWQGISNITCENKNLDGVLCITDGKDVLEKYSFSEEHFVRNILGLLFLLSSFYVLGYYFLKRRVRHV